MKVPLLVNEQPHVRLVEPVVERDAPLGVRWLSGEPGRRTLAMMGVPDKDNRPSTLEKERQRVRGFVENEKQLNWMIELDGAVVGSVWVDLVASKEVPAPAAHIMIGDPAARGKGVGRAAMGLVIAYVKQRGYRAVYSRRLVKNKAVARLFEGLGFTLDGAPYIDADGLEWQNLVLYYN